ncbi:MAG: AAA family ATPase [Campylobacterales bacterium]|nr:AAA family ATPase [Campylobacterales bacterium]
MFESHYNLAFERSLLCSIIFEPVFLRSITLKVSDFYLEAHQNIAKAILLLQTSDKPIDEEFIRIELQKQKKFDERIMIEVLTANPVAYLDPYIIEIKKMAKKREILSAITKIKSLSEEIDGDDLLSQFELTAEKLRNNDALDSFTIQSMHDLDTEDPQFICKEWIPIPKRTVTIFSAGGGTGKTMAALQLALRYIEEENYSKKVFLWLSEDPAGLSKGRAIEIAAKVLHKKFESYKGYLDISDDPTFPVMTFKSSGEGSVKAEFYQMKSKLKEYELIIIDPLIGFFTGDENSNSHARQFMQLFTQWAAKEDKIILFIHHSSKGIRVGNESKTRGASAFVDAVRAVYEFEKIKPSSSETEESLSDKSLRRVVLTKDNYNAHLYFGGFQKDIKLFPMSAPSTIGSNKPVPIKSKLIKQKSKPAVRSTIPPGANIRIVDEPVEDVLSEEEQAIIDRKLKEIAASGIHFDD